MHRFTSLSILLLLICSFDLANTQQKDTDAILHDAAKDDENGNLAMAIEKYREALAIHEKQNDDKAIAQTLYKIGDALRRLGNFPEAAPVLEKALKLQKKLGDKSGTGFVLTAIAALNSFSAKHKEAFVIGEEALAIHEELQNLKGIGHTLLALGNSYYRTDQLEKAVELAQRAFQIATQIEDKFIAAESLNLLGSANFEYANYDKAFEFLNQAMPIARQIPDPSSLAKVYGNISSVYGEIGDNSKALEYLDKSLELHRKVGSRLFIAICLYNRGVMLGDLGNYEKARDSAQEALQISEEIGEDGLTALALSSLDAYNRQLGNYDTALQYLAKAEKLAEQSGDKGVLGNILLNFGNHYSIQQDYRKSLSYYEKAFQLARESGAKRQIALTHYRIGQSYLNLGNREKASTNFEEALKVSQSAGIKPIEAESYLEIGNIYYVNGEMDAADDAFSKSIEISREISFPRSLWSALHKKSLVYRDLGKETEALKLMQESVEVVERVRGEMQLAEDKAGYFQEKLDLYEDLIQLLVKMHKTSEAFEVVQKAKARSFLDMLSEARIDPDGNIDPKLKEEKAMVLAELISTQKNIESELRRVQKDQKKIDRLVHKRNDLDAKFTDIMLEIHKQNPRFDDLKYSPPLNLNEAQQTLDDQSVLLEYSMGKETSFLFAVSRDKVDVFELLGEQKLADKIRTLREVLLKPEPIWEASEKAHSTYIKLAQELYSDLIEPAQKTIHAKGGLVIAPDGALNYLPFESLLSSLTTSKSINFAELPYLIRSYEIRYIPSISVMAALGKEKRVALLEDGPQKEFLAFANPLSFPIAKEKNGVIKESLPALPNAKLEVDRIAKLYPSKSVEVFVGNSATERKLKELKLANYKKLHFASHGLINEEKPEFSALILNRETGSDEDGDLTMGEVFDLNLRADLVALSACKTGLGKQIRGEGVTGLSRAFLCAGASGVLVSLWNVYDRSTADFMTGFYKKIAAGQSKSTALKQTRLEMIQLRKHSHPYYWAPFVMIGNN